MTILAEESTVLAKTRELCASLLEEPDLVAHLEKVEAFVEDTASRTQFIRLNEAGDALHQKQHSGEKLTPEDIEEFKLLQAAAAGNAVIRDFVEAQEKLTALHGRIASYVAKTLELGRVPEEEDFADEGGCCNHGGCGCEH